MRNAPARDEAGFTLIEALVAIVILAFGLLAVSNLLIVAASSNAAGNQSSAATAIASETLESLKAQPFTSLTVGGSIGGSSPTPGFFRDDDIRGVGRIHTEWQIVPRAGDNQTLFIRVRSEPASRLFASRARAEFTTFRSCTATTLGCPAP